VSVSWSEHRERRLGFAFDEVADRVHHEELGLLLGGKSNRPTGAPSRDARDSDAGASGPKIFLASSVTGLGQRYETARRHVLAWPTPNVSSDRGHPAKLDEVCCASSPASVRLAGEPRSLPQTKSSNKAKSSASSRTMWATLVREARRLCAKKQEDGQIFDVNRAAQFFRRGLPDRGVVDGSLHRRVRDRSHLLLARFAELQHGVPHRLFDRASRDAAAEADTTFARNERSLIHVGEPAPKALQRGGLLLQTPEPLAQSIVEGG